MNSLNKVVKKHIDAHLQLNDLQLGEFGFFKIDNQKFFYKVKKNINQHNNSLLPFPRIIHIEKIKQDFFLFIYKDESIHLSIHESSLKIDKKNLIKLTSNFWNRYYQTTLKDKKTEFNKHFYPSSIFYEDRFSGNRSTTWYGKNFFKIKQDVFFLNYKLNLQNILDIVTNYLNSNFKTIFTISHGDLHHFNMTYSFLFFDDETYGYNPVLADIINYDWYLYAQSNWLLPKYKKNFFQNKPNLGKKTTSIQYEIFVNQYRDQYLDLLSDISEDWKSEVVFRYFCRMFFVLNILNFSKKDRLKLYNYLNTILLWFYSDSKKFPFNNI